MIPYISFHRLGGKGKGTRVRVMIKYIVPYL